MPTKQIVHLTKEIKENWFNHHAAKIIRHKYATIIDWKNPYTIYYWVRYVLVDRSLFITGDLGDAVFQFYRPISIENFNGMTLSSFMHCFSCCERDRWDFDSKKAQQEIDEWEKDNLNDEGNDFKDYIQDVCDQLRTAATDYGSSEGYRHAVWSIYDNDDTGNLEAEDYAMFADFGEKLPTYLIGYWVGLQMIGDHITKGGKNNGVTR